MIRDRLSAYYAAFGANPTYHVVRSIMIDDHEVAWMEGLHTRPDGTTFTHRMLHCECEFTEGAGWTIADGKPVQDTGAAYWCIRKKAAQDLRIRELRKEYFDKHLNGEYGQTWGLQHHLEKVILDIQKKVEAGEFVEGDNGARFYGGFVYLQTVADITELRYVDVQTCVDRMQKEKKVTRYEGIIRPYRDPPKPEWVEGFRKKDDDGWEGVAFLPKHDTMEPYWRFEVHRPDGARVEIAQGSLISHSRAFGIDVDDLHEAFEALDKLIASVKAREAARDA